MRHPEPDGKIIARGGNPDAELVMSVLVASGLAGDPAALLAAAKAAQALTSARAREVERLKRAMEEDA
jgi:hypothetical protein